MTPDDIRVEFYTSTGYHLPPDDDPQFTKFVQAVQNIVARGNAELRESLAACVDFMQGLPTLNGLYGLAVLEHARGLLELSAITDDVTEGMRQAGADVLGEYEGHWTNVCDAAHAVYTAMRAAAPTRPVNMVLHCPNCLVQHIDKSEPADPYPTPEKDAARWLNPPHRSHLCWHCGWQWRPSDTPTNGVAALGTRGAADSTGTPAGARDARRWRYTRRPGYFALPPSRPGDLWAVGVGDTRASNSHFGATLEQAIDKALGL